MTESKSVVRLIGISGKIGTGKTLLSRELLERHPSYKRVSFADNLREIVSVLSGIPSQETRSREEKAVVLEGLGGMSVGELLQKVGTEVGRHIHPDIWVVSLFSKFSQEDLWVVDDVRFPNEADAIRKRGGLLIRLEGDPSGIWKSGETKIDGRERYHVSETALDDYPHFDFHFNTKKEWFNRSNEMVELISERISQ